jgi:hypothetical protein
VKKEAAKKAISGIAEAADSIISTCDHSLLKDFLSGVVKSGEDALDRELSTRTILSSRQPAEVTHIDKEKEHKTKETETETGGIERSQTTESNESSQLEGEGSTLRPEKTVSSIIED